MEDWNLEPPSCIVPDNLEEYRTNKLRRLRNAELSATDWTQMMDNGLSPEERKSWADYRQELRDMPGKADVSRGRVEKPRRRPDGKR